MQSNGKFLARGKKALTNEYTSFLVINPDVFLLIARDKKARQSLKLSKWLKQYSKIPLFAMVLVDIASGTKCQMGTP
jgi:hypothetical protein